MIRYIYGIFKPTIIYATLTLIISLMGFVEYQAHNGWTEDSWAFFVLCAITLIVALPFVIFFQFKKIYLNYKQYSISKSKSNNKTKKNKNGENKK